MLGFLTDPAFWQVYFPAWMQGLGTIAAAVLGWYAFRVWGRQENARRKAELAEKILTKGFAAVGAINFARTCTPRGGRSVEEDAERAIGGGRTHAVQKMSSMCAELSAFADLATMRLSKEVGEAIRLLEEQAQMVRVSFFALSDSVRNGYQFVDGGPSKEEILNAFMDVLVAAPGKPRKGRKRRADELERDIAKAMVIIREGCEPYLDYARS